MQEIRAGAELVAIHDSARPLVTAEDTRRCCKDALQVGFWPHPVQPGEDPSSCMQWVGGGSKC